MESKFIEPANGECIGRWHSIIDKIVLFGIMFLFYFPLFILIAFIFNTEDVVKVFFAFIYLIIYYIILTFILLFFYKRTWHRLNASRRLFVSEKGLVLNKTLNKYEIIEISNIYLDRNIINFRCKYKTPRFSIKGGYNIMESEFEYKIEKRFREKPNELLEYLNNLCDLKMKKLN